MDRVLRSIAGFHAGHGRLLQPHLETLAQDGQRPQIMVITCADSRILLDPLVNSEPGIVFAVRNVGNLVPNDGIDHSVAAAVTYGVTALHVPDIIVMGHSECGAMKALLGPRIEGPVGDWLKYGEESVEHLGDGHVFPDLPQHDQLSQQNVLTQAERLLDMPVIRDNGTAVHAWWWNMADAQVMAYDGRHFVSIEEAYKNGVKSPFQTKIENAKAVAL
ncbi:MAG: hypothetical protein EOP83_26670 [Verrucomicrobiaceae bacterium]|nr:MAG: hypothetical protein EOP83_26670 [Verrucomicrobiaceae bacterium]